MEFKPGQRVICVNDQYRSYSRYPVTKGMVYTIHSNYQCPCGSRQVTLMEFPGRTPMGCRCPRTSNRRPSYYNWRFIPLDLYLNIMSLTSDISEPIEQL
jgi:hypothetical protein